MTSQTADLSMTSRTDDLSSMFGVAYSLVTTCVLIAHQVWLYFIQRRVLADLGSDPDLAPLDALFTWVPLALWVVAMVAAVCVGNLCYGEPWMVIRSVNSTAIVVILFTYTSQIIYYFIRDLVLYLHQLTPEEALCFCAPFLSLSAQTGSDVYNCTCLVPHVSYVQMLVTAANVTEGLDSSILMKSSIEWSGNVTTRLGEPLYVGAGVRSVHSFVTLNEMLIVLALSLLVSVMRFPLWTALSFIITLVRDTRAAKKPKNRGKVSVHDFRLGFPWRWIRDNWVEGDAVEVCYCGFVEGIDSFSLLAAILNHGDMFAENVTLTAGALFLAAFNLVVVHLSGVLVALRPPKVKTRSADQFDACAPETRPEAFYVAAVATLPYFSHRRKEKRRRTERGGAVDGGTPKVTFKLDEPAVVLPETGVPSTTRSRARKSRACAPISLKYFTLGTKFLMIISCNLPFFVFRMYVYYISGGFRTKGEPIFLLLTIKEAVVLLMGVLRFALGNKKIFRCRGNKVTN